MAGALGSIILTTGTATVAGLKLIGSILFGTPYREEYEYTNILMSSYRSNVGVRQTSNSEVNGWNRHPVVEDKLRYRKGKRYRYSTGRDNTLYLLLILTVSTVIILSVLYIMSNSFRKYFNNGVINLFQKAGSEANKAMPSVKNTAMLSRIALTESPLLKVFNNKYFKIILIILILVCLVVFGMVFLRGVRGALLIADCSTKTQRIDVDGK